MGEAIKGKDKNKITLLREKMGWSQSFVAESIGCSREYINLLERGKKRNPSAIVIKKLAYLYGTTADDILKDLGV